MLIDREIRKLIKKKNMIENYIDLKIQLQSNGFDLSLSEVFAFSSSNFEQCSIIDFSNEERRVNPCIFVSSNFNDGFFLEKGIYLFKTNEMFNMPKDIAALAFPRSSLNRVGGILNSAIIDAGYSGGLAFVVSLATRIIFTKNARFVQLIFFRLKEIPDKIYDGVYKKRKIK